MKKSSDQAGLRLNLESVSKSHPNTAIGREIHIQYRLGGRPAVDNPACIDGADYAG